MRNIPINKKYLFACIVLALLLCIAQVTGNSVVIMGCLVLYMAFLAWSCSYNFTLPILLFFLPWSPIMRLGPESFSFYTFGLVLVCLISVIKKRFEFQRYQLIAGIFLLLVSLLSKLLDGSGLSFAYIAFIMMIVLFPVVQEEKLEQKYDFHQIVVFFSWGVIIASLCAMYFAEFSNIRKFIRVDSYLTIIRRCGFYGDPNFYVAQVLAALGGVLSLTLQELKKKQVIFLGISALFLTYCGFLSGSKSFALGIAVIVLLWIIAILKMRGKAGLKIVLLVFLIAAGVYISTSALFKGLIEVIITRFNYARDWNSFTTGRFSLWKSYADEIFGNIKVFFLGKGLTNIKVDGRGSHSTIIQIFYQLGLVGVPVLVYWIVSFFRSNAQVQRKQKTFILHRLMVSVGVFLPWVAIDILFFDEFFLLLWYIIAAREFEKLPETEIGLEEQLTDGP